jgi:hypothetical protein
MRNVLIVGICGAGKTTLAGRVARLLAVPVIELDALRHGPDWSVRTDMAAEVARLTGVPGWVVDSDSYPDVRELLWARSDTVVWLDLRRAAVLVRVARRTARRVLTREVLWAGNRETARGVLARDHPIPKVLLDFHARRARIAAAVEGFRGTVVHLRTPAAVDRWLGTGARPSEAGGPERQEVER